MPVKTVAGTVITVADVATVDVATEETVKVIDELVDSGMDANGVENSMSVLKKMGRERQKNIYLISHKEELAGRVTNVLKVVKENGFTSYDNDVEIMQ